jgi:D-inositol-3-phosphate glycosyltransferase
MVSLHTSPEAQPGTADAGGMNVAILGLAVELAARGVEVDLLTRAVGVPTVRQLAPGVTLRELAAGGAGAIIKERLSEVTDEFGEAIAALARDERYDIIHAHYWLSGIASLPVALELGIPFVQSFHTVAAMKDAALGLEGATEPLIRVRSESYLGRQADAIIAASSAEAAALIDAAGAPADALWIIPPGVDLDIFRPRGIGSARLVRAALGIGDTRKLVVLAGRIQPLKGHELAVRTVGVLRASGAQVPLLIVAGEATPGDSRYELELRELARSLGVEADVRFVGALGREQLAELFAAASVTLVPSFSETFGLVALESAASGTPVLGYMAGGLVESVDDGVTGVLMKTRDAVDWARELDALLVDDDRRARLGLAGRAFAEHFTWGAAATSLLAVYASLVAGSGRP